MRTSIRSSRFDILAYWFSRLPTRCFISRISSRTSSIAPRMWRKCSRTIFSGSVMARNYHNRKPLSPRQLFVLHAMRDDGILAQPAHLVFFIILEIAFEPFDMAVAFEGQNMRGDAVEEPAVMADDHGAAGEILQRLFERAQGVDVEIVGGLVEQQHVGAGLEHLGQMNAVALAARQCADLLLLVGALEIERRAIAARIDLAFAEQDLFVAAGNFLPHALF